MIRRPKVKWVAPIVLTGALLAGGSAAIAADTFNNSDEEKAFDFPTTGKRPSKEDMEARRAEMQEQLAAKVASGAISQAEADDIRAKMSERKAKFDAGKRPSKEDMEARRAEMQKQLAAKVASGAITQAEADDIRAKMSERKAEFEKRRSLAG